MDTIGILRILFTSMTFVLFTGILAWAWFNRKSAEFERAQRLPFDQDQRPLGLNKDSEK
jgi:cytochrome c oxidase cbb3-type subunit IV